MIHRTYPHYPQFYPQLLSLPNPTGFHVYVHILSTKELLFNSKGMCYSRPYTHAGFAGITKEYKR